MAHIRRAAEAGEAAAGHRGGVSVAVNLKGRTDKHIYRILSRQLAEGAVGAHGAVGAGKEDIRTRANVLFHPQLAAEAVDALYPAAFNRRNQRRVRIQRPVFTDLTLQTELFAVGW